MSDNAERVDLPERTQLPGHARSKTWLLHMDAAEIIPLVFVMSRDQEAFRAEIEAIERWPQLILRLGTGRPKGWCREWLAMLQDGGKVRLSFSRSSDNRVLLKFDVPERNDTGRVTIEMTPSFGFLREEWERVTAALADPEDATAEFSSRLLDALPLGCVVPLPTEGPADCIAWIEEQLARRGQPLAESHEYARSEVLFDACEERLVLITYPARKDPPILHQSMGWVRVYVSGAFDSPLLSGVSLSPGLPPPRVVPLALDDLLDVARLSEIQPDRPGAEDRVRNGFAKAGTESLGWYQPYHQYDEQHWGIYLSVAPVLDLGHVLRDRLSSLGCTTPLDGFDLAMRLVLQHELFHARTETFALGLELSAKTPIYNRYSENVRKHVLGNDDALEEAIANYVARDNVSGLVALWRKARKWQPEHCQAVVGFIDELFRLSPPGYRHWALGASRATWRRLACQVDTGMLEPPEPLAPLEPMLKWPPNDLLGLSQMPLWLAGDHAIRRAETRKR